MGGCKPPYFGEKMSNITLYAVATAIVMLTSMVWYLIMNVTHWTPEAMITVCFIFGGGASTMYLLSLIATWDD
jgi:predicted membrane channel-forming protein YqfA (hemolysin III family)